MENPADSWSITSPKYRLFHQESRKQSTPPKRYRLSNPISDSGISLVCLKCKRKRGGWDTLDVERLPLGREINIKWNLCLIGWNISTEETMSYACVVNLWLVCVLINFSGSLCNSIIDDPVQSLQDHLSKYYSFLQMFFGHNLMFLITCSYPKTKLDKLFKKTFQHTMCLVKVLGILV